MNAFIISQAAKKESKGYILSVPFKFNKNFNLFMTSNNLIDNITSHILFVMIMFLTEAIAQTAIPDNDVIYVPDVAEMTQEDKVLARQGLLEIRKSAITWVIDLIAANQVRALSNSNVKNYFMQFDNLSIDPANIRQLIVWGSAKFPKIMEDEALLELVSSSKFMGYHTSYSSTASLIVKVAESLGGHRDKFISEETYEIVRASFDEKHSMELNQAIPEKVIAMTYVYLDVFDILPDNWYQGMRSFDAASPALLTTWRSIFKRMKALSKDMEAINAALNIPSLMELVGDELKA